MSKYKTTKKFTYKSQNKRGGRPMVIDIPAGSIGTKQNEYLIFHSLSRGSHNPFVFWTEAHAHVKPLSED